MKTILLAVLCALALSASVRADQVKVGTSLPVLSPANTSTQVMIQVAGKTVATLFLNEFPKDAQFNLTSEKEILYDQAKGTMTMAGPFDFEIRSNNKTLLRLSFPGGVVIAGEPKPDNFCGQSQVEAMIRNTPLAKEIERQAREEAKKTKRVPMATTTK